MPTIVKLNLRKSVWSEDLDNPGSLRKAPAFTEEVDLDELTPRARALAEAITACTGHQPLDIRLQRDTLKRDNPNFAHIYGEGHEKGEEHEQAVVRWDTVMRADSPMTAVEWLEREARTLPLDTYVYGTPWGDPVPSMEAGAADRYLVRGNVLEYMRERGYDMGVQAWDTLRGTGHLPEPDRYVCGRPQWRPETIDAYINRDRELWTISRVAEYLGYSGPSATGSARKQLSRWGITAEGRAPGRGGESLYAADQVQAAHTHRPGRGARTDLKSGTS